MFSRFRNLFSKSKADSESATEVGTPENGTSEVGTSYVNASAPNGIKGFGEEVSKLEGFNFLKSLVETEKNISNKETVVGSTPKLESNEKVSPSLSQEVAEMLKDTLSSYEENLPTNNGVNGLAEELKITNTTNENHVSVEAPKQKLQLNGNFQNDNDISCFPTTSESTSLFQKDKVATADLTDLCNSDNIVTEISTSLSESNELYTNDNISSPHDNKLENSNDSNEISKLASVTLNNDEEKMSSDQTLTEEAAEISKPISESREISDNETNLKKSSEMSNGTTESSKLIFQTNGISHNDVKQISFEQTATEQISESLTNGHEQTSNFTNDISENSQSSSMKSVKENNASSTTLYPTTDSETNLSTNSSIVVDDLPSEVNTPSPSTVDSTISGSSSNISTLDTCVLSETSDPTKIIVNPINSNILACNAITTKLTDIAEVAESLDTVIRNIQENSQSVEVESNPSPSDKKLGTLRSTSSEDWHSRSTEDDSFATASEGNFTPHSHSSSSFQTASGRTSSYISCNKNSFDASEADDSTFAFEMPELTSPHNMSFEGSEQSYLSAQHLAGDHTPQDQEQTPTKLSENGSQTFNQGAEDQCSIADIEELHSESVTPTPQDNHDYQVDSIPIESETELEVAGISDAPSMDILTETVAMPMSRTPEVSSSSTTAALNPQMLNNNDASANEQNTNKPNAAWRRSKYYENITKQTIKGFL